MLAARRWRFPLVTAGSRLPERVQAPHPLHPHPPPRPVQALEYAAAEARGAVAVPGGAGGAIGGDFVDVIEVGCRGGWVGAARVFEGRGVAGLRGGGESQLPASRSTPPPHHPPKPPRCTTACCSRHFTTSRTPPATPPHPTSPLTPSDVRRHAAAGLLQHHAPGAASGAGPGVRGAMKQGRAGLLCQGVAPGGA
jgi:hypothetical protein